MTTDAGMSPPMFTSETLAVSAGWTTDGKDGIVVIGIPLKLLSPLFTHGSFSLSILQATLYFGGGSLKSSVSLARVL